MDPKIKDSHILNVSNGLRTSSKANGKEKARQKLWDSLLAVYVDEVGKENVAVMDEVDVHELEEWSVTHPDISLRAQTQLAKTKPQILTAAGFPDLLLELELEEKPEITEKHANKRKIQKNCSEALKNCGYKSPSFMKTKKKFSPIRKFKKSKQTSQKKNLSVDLTKRKIQEKSKKLGKTEKELKVSKEELKEVGSEKKQRKQKLIHLGEFKECLQSTDNPKNEAKLRNIKLKTKKEITPDLQCKLEYRTYLNTKNDCTRPDKRVFNCKLIFKVCHSCESDILL